LNHDQQGILQATEQKLGLALADLQRGQAEAARAHRDLMSAQQLVQQQAEQLSRLHEAERRAATVDQRVAAAEERTTRREAETKALREKMRVAQSGWEAWYQKAMQAEQALLQQMDQLKQRAERAECVHSSTCLYLKLLED
jgi:predicted  nucleic acid-binding Zn-ribbon protein